MAMRNSTFRAVFDTIHNATPRPARRPVKSPRADTPLESCFCGHGMAVMVMQSFTPGAWCGARPRQKKAREVNHGLFVELRGIQAQTVRLLRLM